MNIFEKLTEQYSSSPSFSSKHEEYWNLYREILSHIDLNEDINIFEIGVDLGIGILSLNEIFPNGKFTGLDKTLKAGTKEFAATLADVFERNVTAIKQINNLFTIFLIPIWNIQCIIFLLQKHKVTFDIFHIVV